MSPRMVQTWGNTVFSSLSLTLGSFGSRSGLGQLLEGLRRRCEEAAKMQALDGTAHLKMSLSLGASAFPKGK